MNTLDERVWLKLAPRAVAASIVRLSQYEGVLAELFTQIIVAEQDMVNTYTFAKYGEIQC